MKKAAVDALLLAQREKYLSLLMQTLPIVERRYIEAMAGFLEDAECKQVISALQAVREAFK